MGDSTPQWVLKAAAAADHLSPSQAGKLRGLLGFTLLPVMWRFGRAATQPLLERQYAPRGPFGWTAPLRAMHTFFARNLPDLPSLRVPMKASRVKPVLLYTDASYFLHRGEHVLWIGFYLYDPVSGTERWGERFVPKKFFRHFAPGKKTYIMQGELLAAVSAVITNADVLHDRSVLMFIDNIGALSTIVHGYARKPDMACMVNAFHSLVREHRIFPWAEWVPSKANIADWASRPDLFHRIPATAVKVPIEFPLLADFFGLPE